MINEKPIKVKTINDKPRSKIDFMTTETIKIGNKKSKNAKLPLCPLNIEIKQCE